MKLLKAFGCYAFHLLELLLLILAPVYRDKVTIINNKLAERYAYHPAVIGWHISNEFGDDCHCSYCQDEFRAWLQRKYINLDTLNHAWWSTFWSHTITEWSQIESPTPHGENYVHAMNLDWKRFVTDQTVDFYKHEIASLRAANPEIVRVIDTELPHGVTAQLRTDGEFDYVFIMNFIEKQQTVKLVGIYTDMITGQTMDIQLTLLPYGIKILKRKTRIENK